MQPIPQPITNVTIHLYQGNAIAEMIVWQNGAGTYSVGTLTTNVFYNLDLTSGEPVNGGPKVGDRYYATYTDASGNEGQTPWMHCLTADRDPTFGRTISMLKTRDAQSGDVAPRSDLAMQLHLSSASVIASPPDQPIAYDYITGATVEALYEGPMDASWTATATGGAREADLSVGDRVVIRGTNSGGTQQAVPDFLYCTDAGDPATFSSKKDD